MPLLARTLSVLLVLLVAAACTTGGPAARDGRPASRARCLVDPNESGARPLIFLLCVESP